MRKRTFTVRRTPQNWDEIVTALNKVCGVAVREVTGRSVTVTMASSVPVEQVENLIDQLADLRAVRDANPCVL